MPAVAIVKSSLPESASPATVSASFRRLLASGASILPAGAARANPVALLSMGYTPKNKVRLFGCDFFLTHQRREDEFRFFVAYVRLATRANELYPRIFYKDSSLIWRSASHFIDSENEQWIGKGDLKTIWEDGEEHWSSAEETTNLPFELQASLDAISRRVRRAREDKNAIELILRRAPDNRIRPYTDFSGPRRRAMARTRDRINGGREIAWFEREDDPESLRFEHGYEADFSAGLIDTNFLRSRMYGGDVFKYRILSRNRIIQYTFVAAPSQIWILPAQTVTTELSSYGVRTIDVHADENLFLPGYEFHYIDNSGQQPALHSQIPAGFAGAPSEIDPSRADTSPWNDALPVIREFRRHFPRHA